LVRVGALETLPLFFEQTVMCCFVSSFNRLACWQKQQTGNAMKNAVFVLLAAAFLGSVFAAKPAAAEPAGRYEVFGVEGEDMLKMRAGPGIDFNVIVGLPNGTVLWVRSCEQTGGTRWCKVALDQARGLRGYVSWAYLRKM
jgi:uncharacterized protein YraI